MEDRAVIVQSLSKTFDKVRALHEVSFEVSRGEIFGMIGPDGAGKTTLFRILSTLMLPGSGQAEVLGTDVVKNYRKLRKRIGYMPGRFSLYPDLTVRENLEFYATIFGTTPAENYHLIRDIYIQIEPFSKRRAGALSGGMKQKLALCCALIHKPDLLILDEPTTGVDAVSRKEFWEMLLKLKQGGMSILVSTPYMDEAAQCDNIALIQEGRILVTAAPHEVTASFSLPLLGVRSNAPWLLLNDLRQWPYAESVQPFGEFIHVIAQPGHGEPQALLSFLKEKGHPDPEVRVLQAGIEDCFMHLMGAPSHAI